MPPEVVRDSGPIVCYFKRELDRLVLGLVVDAIIIVIFTYTLVVIIVIVVVIIILILATVVLNRVDLIVGTIAVAIALSIIIIVVVVVIRVIVGLSIASNRNRNVSFPGKLQCIANQIKHHLFEPSFVVVDVSVFFWTVPIELQSRLLLEEKEIKAIRKDRRVNGWIDI